MFPKFQYLAQDVFQLVKMEGRRMSHSATVDVRQWSGIRKKPIPDPGSRGQKSLDPGSGSATLLCTSVYSVYSVSWRSFQ